MPRNTRRPGRRNGLMPATGEALWPAPLTVEGEMPRTLGSPTRSRKDLPASYSALGEVGLRRQRVQLCEERARLADEKSHGREEAHCPHRGPLRLGRPNDRAYRQAAAQKHSWLGHNEIGLEVLVPGKWRHGEVRKHETVGGVGHRRRVARLVV